MSLNRPNILFLTADAFRRDRSSLHGYQRPTTPNLERMAKRGIVCDNAFALATFTQAACISLLTSSRPFSFGGYDQGARGRPQTLFKRFHEAGYTTSCLSTLHWVNRFFGYGEGVDEEIQLSDIKALFGVAVTMMRNSILLYEEKVFTEERLLREVTPVLEKLFDDCGAYCDLHREKREELKTHFSETAFINARYDYRRVMELVSKHQEAFRSDPGGYVHQHLVPAPGFGDWMGRWIPKELHLCREPAKLVAESLFRTGNKALELFNPLLAKQRRNRFKVYPDARSLADRVIATLETHDGDQPLFLWTHFMDTHMPFVSGAGTNWYKETPDYLAALGHPRDVDPSLAFDRKPKRPEDGAGFSALYDAAMRSTDVEIGRILDALERTGMAQETLVVFSGDHGEELGEHGDFGHYFLLYDHNTRIPMVLHHPDLEAQRISAFTSPMDLAPTIAELAGIDPDPGWEGHSVLSPEAAARDAVLMETFYGGNCLFENRDFYFGARNEEFLYLWKDQVDARDKFSPAALELYDVADDPDQQHNIFDPGHPALPRFHRLIADRLAELDLLTPERRAKLLPGEAPS